MDEVELTKELVKINSENPPGNERDIAKYIRDYLDDLKISAELIEFEKNRFNVVASVGNGRGIMFNGHMDTVPIGNVDKWNYDPLCGKIVDGKIYGRGASDMKGGIAAILAAVKKTSKENFKGKLLLTFVADEEISQRGSAFLIKNRKGVFRGVKYGIMAECNEMKMTVAQKGIVHFRVTFEGKAAHGAVPEKGDNAIYKASKFIEELRKLSTDLCKKRNQILGSGTINVGTIQGGTKVNVVPDLCTVGVDRRIIPGETTSYALKQIKEILKKNKLKANIELINSRASMQLSKNSEIVRMIMDIANPTIVGDPGYTEAEMYFRDAKIQCVSFGPGRESQAHVVNEYIPIKSLRKSTKIYEKLIRRVCL